ncbi:hypothetical protein ABZ215_13640 [Amycolatopsis sp. NPDC006131]|uniref:hypothetical protein n=1 Tax=Amycolatopsis sp. NPDC006131 TaxID=3156731 RepID=UPI0033A3C525
MTDSFDSATARGTLRVLQLAHDRWQDVCARLHGLKFEDLDGREEVAHVVRGPAVETLMWARGLDDFCRGMPKNGRATQAVLDGYEAGREHLSGLVDGARYATNRSVHQLLALMRPLGAFVLPMKFPFGFDHFGGVKWLHEQHLPPADQEQPGQGRLRVAYVNHLASRDVGPTLDALRAWFEQQLA